MAAQKGVLYRILGVLLILQDNVSQAVSKGGIMFNNLIERLPVTRFCFLDDIFFRFFRKQKKPPLKGLSRGQVH